jgi:hypothetical protein
VVDTCLRFFVTEFVCLEYRMMLGLSTTQNGWYGVITWFCKPNCTLNWPFGTLKLPGTPLVVSLVFVITCDVQISRGAECKIRKFPLLSSA